MINCNTPAEVESHAIKKLDIPGLQAEYFEIVDGKSLQKIHRFKDAKIVVACTAVRVGEVRLIDNMVLKP